ncbi:MAG: cysteine desulfurase [Steroidobacteraceae bacterium]|jgi:cysteine desulfurase/selenocysteine lyase|nr:cysteine desulfurase [Steroidobacteraceae bacterium]
MAAELQALAPLDVARIREDFPILARAIRGKPLVYLDSGASAQRPKAVIDAMSGYYERHHANVHRGVHTLSQEATDLFEGAREKVRRFLNAASTREIVFVRGTTEAINLVAQSWGRSRLKPGDEIVITWLEHHANIVPWQMACEQTGAVLKIVPIDRRGVVDHEAYLSMLGPRTKLAAFSHVSNALGTVLPVREMVAAARERGIVTLIDGAQAVPHQAVDVREIGCDFYAFSGHKLFGPTGIGVLYGREAVLAAMPPWQGGGDMILTVSFSGTTYNELPYRFEAGTPDIAGAIGLGAAIDYVDSLGLERIAAWEHELLDYATRRLSAVPGLEIVGTAPDKASLVSFTIEGVHPHDLGTILDAEGIAIRTGHHCAMPVMEFFDLPATARASFAFYNTREEIDVLAAALVRAREMLG